MTIPVIPRTPLADRAGAEHGGSVDEVLAYAVELLGRPVAVTVLDGHYRPAYEPAEMVGKIVATARALSGGGADRWELIVQLLEPYNGRRGVLAVPVRRVLALEPREQASDQAR
jgi:hypothetical protein